MEKIIKELISIALKEDLQEIGDVSSDAIFTDEQDSFILKARNECILCGIDIFRKVFLTLDSDCKVESFFKDGDYIPMNSLIAEISGKTITVLKGERTALNFLSHLSGIATKTDRFVRKVKNKVKILDTRKTIPGLRTLQKYAVRCGGGRNHRMGLYDMVMIKDNHIDSAGSITKTVSLIRKRWGDRFKIEVETRNLDEVREALENNVNIIMLDNMGLDMVKQAVKYVNGRTDLEISGNITLDQISSAAETGVDYISVGALTHSVKAIDFSLIRNI